MCFRSFYLNMIPNKWASHCYGNYLKSTFQKEFRPFFSSILPSILSNALRIKHTPLHHLCNFLHHGGSLAQRPPQRPSPVVK